MSLFQELLDTVDRMELALSIAYAELEAMNFVYEEADESDDDEVYFAARKAIRAACLKCEDAYNAVTASQIDVDIYLESYDRPARS